MLKKIEIRNYKSIYELSLELGRFNVFIGENGSGKTNILEAIAMLSGALNDRLSIEDLVNQGVRVTKPNLTFSSFRNQEMESEIAFNLLFGDAQIDSTDSIPLELDITCDDTLDNLYATWKIHMYEDGIDYSENALRDFFNSKGLAGNEMDFKNLSNSFRKLFKVKGLKLSKDYPTLGHSPYYQRFGVYLKKFIIYNLDSQSLRGITNESLKMPLGIHGERLDLLLSNFTKEELQELEKYKYVINWLDEIILDKENSIAINDFSAKGKSTLFFSDKFMKKNQRFNIDNANEGILHILFYLALFISKDTPQFFAIDNIETALNPQLCRHLTEVLSTLNPSKQALITTHNPAILDGLDLTNDDIRLFEVKRNTDGHTKCRRIQFKKGVDTKKFKLSEMWMRGLLGAIPKHF